MILGKEQALQIVSLLPYNPEMANLYQYTNETIAEILVKDAGKFIQPGDPDGFFTWMNSMGTNITCYAGYLRGITKEDNVGGIVDLARTIIYACAKPLQSQFFYWTLLLLILHKFNFKKPVMKIILAHYVLRSIGDIFDQLSGLMGRYYVNGADGNCVIGVSAAEQHPFRWFLTRQIGCIFWYLGEICGDWYPLLRTRAVARDQRSMIWVYISCGLFNLSKVALFVMQFFMLPASQLYKVNTKENQYRYNEEQKDKYYNIYWVAIAVIIIFSLIYDLTVYFVLKRQIFSRAKNEFGFLKKFRTISEYRIIVSVLICAVLLPVVLLTIAAKYYFLLKKDFKKVNFSFEDIRLLIINVQYYMIFIDQIMLFRSRDDSSMGETTSMTTGGNYTSNNFSSNNNSNQLVKPYNIDSKLYYTNLNTLNNTIQNSAQSNLMQYNYSNNNNMNFGRSNSNYTRNNTIANYDDYNGTTNEWNYLRR